MTRKSRRCQRGHWKGKEVVSSRTGEENYRAGNQVFLLFAPSLHFWFCNSEIGNFYAAEFSFRFVSCSMVYPGSGKARNLSRQSGKERQEVGVKVVLNECFRTSMAFFTILKVHYVVFDKRNQKFVFVLLTIPDDGFFSVKIQRKICLTQKYSRNLYVTSFVIKWHFWDSLWPLSCVTLVVLSFVMFLRKKKRQW